MVRSLVVLMLAIICGGAAAYGVLQLRRPASVVKAELEMAQILVASQYLAKGQTLTEKDVRVEPWPEKYRPKDAITEVSGIQGRVVLVPMVADDPVIQTKLAASDSESGLAGLLDKGKRAFTIQANTAASNVAGFVRPGNIVDVLVHLRSNVNDDTGGGETKTLLQAIEILAVDQVLDEATGKVSPDLKSVTLEVTPEQANALDCGQNAGQLTLSLRNPKDREPADTKSMTVQDIRNLNMKPETEVSSPTDDKSLGSWFWELYAAAAQQASDVPQKKVQQPDPVVRTLRGSSWGSVTVSDR